MRLKENFIKRTTEWRGRAVGFQVDQVSLPNGKKAIREYLDHPGAVAVIPFVTPEKVVVVRQYRYPVGQTTVEIPAGKLDRGESPLLCVKRELEEETGYRSRRIQKLVSFWPTAAFANEIIHVYSADKLIPGKMQLDSDEFLNCEVWPLKKMFRAIKEGRIRDSKTLIAFLMYRTFYKSR